MSGFAVFWLVVFAVVLVAVIVVRALAARAIRAAGEPSERLPTGEAFAREALDARGLGVVTIVDADVDAYRAAPREIQLAGGRFDHGSAASVAVAALEVAHAAQHAAGSPTWRRWWVISGHTVWAGPLMLLVLLVQLVVVSPILALVTFACIFVLAASGLLSARVEQAAVATARDLLADADLGERANATEIDRALRWAARAYVAESVFDLGFLDRAVESSRGPSWGSPPMSG